MQRPQHLRFVPQHVGNIWGSRLKNWGHILRYEIQTLKAALKQAMVKFQVRIPTSPIPCPKIVAVQKKVRSDQWGAPWTKVSVVWTIKKKCMKRCKKYIYQGCEMDRGALTRGPFNKGGPYKKRGKNEFGVSVSSIAWETRSHIADVCGIHSWKLSAGSQPLGVRVAVAVKAQPSDLRSRVSDK